jgi:hypothetical protein
MVLKAVDEKELELLHILDAMVRQKSAMIDPIVLRVERKLIRDSEASLAWEPVPLALYGDKLPDIIRSSWVFVLRALTNTGPERHPNSHQRMMSYRGSGDLQTRTGDGWGSNLLVSGHDTCIQSRWISIPPNTWHRAIVPEENWAVVSFHTVAEGELIEERPDKSDAGLMHQRKYMETSHYQT